MEWKKYRIVADNHLGFECQEWVWYWPFWSQMDFCNTFPSLESAKEYILAKNKPLWESSKPKV